MSLTYDEWRRTPYAQTDAKDPDRQLFKLLDKYNVRERQWTDHTGPEGRPAISLRFNLRDKTYRVTFEVLSVLKRYGRPDNDELIRQAKRVMYWTLKPLLEATVVWGPPERLLLPFLEADSGETMYEIATPGIKTLKQKDLAALFHHATKALPRYGEGEFPEDLKL